MRRAGPREARAIRALIDGLPEVEVHQLYRGMDLVVGGDSEARRRFVVARNPEKAERERLKREDIAAEVERRLGETSSFRRTEKKWLLMGQRGPLTTTGAAGKLWLTGEPRRGAVVRAAVFDHLLYLASTLSASPTWTWTKPSS